MIFLRGDLGIRIHVLLCMLTEFEAVKILYFWFLGTIQIELELSGHAVLYHPSISKGMAGEAVINYTCQRVTQAQIFPQNYCMQ